MSQLSLTGAGQGVQVLGAAVTYSTWNPSDKHADIALSGGNLVGTVTTGGSFISMRGTVGVSSGKWYWEVTVTTTSNVQMSAVAKSTATLNGFMGSDANGWSYYGGDGQKRNNGVAAAYGASYGTGTVVSCALDLDNGKVWWAKNGTWQNSGDPAAGTGEAYSGLSGTFYAAWTLNTLNDLCTANFGASAFTYTVPTGFNEGLYE